MSAYTLLLRTLIVAAKCYAFRGKPVYYEDIKTDFEQFFESKPEEFVPREINEFPLHISLVPTWRNFNLLVFSHIFSAIKNGHLKMQYKNNAPIVDVLIQ